MALSQKRPPNVVTNQEMSRVIQDIYACINEIIAEVNQKSSSAGVSKPSDPEGTIRLVKTDKNTYGVEMKFKDGWVKSTSTAFEFKEGD